MVRVPRCVSMLVLESTIAKQDIFLQEPPRLVRKTAPTLETGWKLNPNEAMLEAKASLKNTKTVGQVQHRQRGFGLGITEIIKINPFGRTQISDRTYT